MATKAEARAAISKAFGSKQDRLDSWPAYLGNEDGTVDAGNGMVYVRYPSANSPAMQVYNGGVPEVAGLRIMVGYRPERPNLIQALGVADVRTETGDITYAILKKHATQHYWTGGDPVYLTFHQITPLGVYVSSGFTVSIYAGVIERAGAIVSIAAQTLDLSAAQPTTTGEGRYVLITLDAAGAIASTNGTINSDYTTLSYADIPATPTGHFRLAAVCLYAGQASLRDSAAYSDILDLRFPQERMSGTLHVNMIGDATAQYQYIVAGATPFTAAWSAGLLNIASGKTLAVSNTLTLAGAADGYTLTVPATGTAALGTGASGRVGYWSGTNTLSSSSGLTYNDTLKELIIGTGTVVSPTGAVIVARTLSGTSLFEHAIRDESTFTSSTAGDAYASFDAQVIMTGSVNYGHIYTFQCRPVYQGSGTLGTMAGMTFQPTIEGPVTNAYGCRILNPTVSGSGSLTFFAAFSSPELSAASGNYFLYSEGASTPSYHAGFFQTGADIQAGGKILASNISQSDVRGSMGFGTGVPAASTLGYYNAFYGYHAGYSASGDAQLFTTMIGTAAGYANVSGSNNTIVGSYAGYNATGDNNVYIGTKAGYSETGSGNVFIGNSAGYWGDAGNKLYISNSNTSSPLIYGDFSNGYIKINSNNATTNAVDMILTIAHNSSGTAAAGFGSRQLWTLQSSTTADTTAAAIDVVWNTATHASRKADLIISVYDTAAREGLRLRGNGSAAAIGFLGATPAAQQTGGSATAGGTYGATEQGMLQKAYDALRTFGLLS